MSPFKPLSPQQQRFFGIAVAAAIGMLAWFAWRAFHWPWLSAALASAGALFAVVYYLIPAAQPRLVAVFRMITFPIQWIMTLIVLSIVYYVVVTPISIWFRWSGKSIRATNRNAKTNWHPIEDSQDPESYFRTF